MFVALIIERTRAEYWARCAASNEILKAPGASVGLSGMVLLRVAFGSCPMLGRTRLRYLEAGWPPSGLTSAGLVCRCSSSRCLVSAA